MARGNAGDTQGRRRHYGAFYGLEPLPDGAPLAVVHGNCQAESLRLALEGDGLVTVRIPPVHELEAADLPDLVRLLARVDLLITQPVHADYRGLSLGSAQLTRRLEASAVVVVVPVIRYAGLYPLQAIVRPPADQSLTPPLVPYHDLSILVEAAGQDPLRPPGADVVAAIAAQSLTELRRREVAHDALVVSDLFENPDFAQMRTINHPGNPVWEQLAGRVRARLGLPAGRRLTRPLLNAIHAPRAEAVIDAFGLEAAADPCWHVDGQAVEPDELRRVHLSWYRDHPEAVAEGLRRHAGVLQLLRGQ